MTGNEHKCLPAAVQAGELHKQHCGMVEPLVELVAAIASEILVEALVQLLKQMVAQEIGAEKPDQVQEAFHCCKDHDGQTRVGLLVGNELENFAALRSLHSCGGTPVEKE